MLPARHRLRASADFASAVRGPGSRRSGGRLLVVHANRIADRAALPPRAGFVVSRSVGNAVVRNRTKRRLRAIVAAHLDLVEPGTDLVVRANPAAAHASYAELDVALARQLEQACARVTL
ncbi:MAG TPA: ribonuclease P protein component [Intrasporangium sp.]|uniref:ribonuclease P protein component n=1 Tax=Intrasporangium sp. TaxID=1925024 RepID=UPI002D7A32B5|nr:ribonuclease P protein component [Intrasporangium sp.]HET7398937.1 ribonuclease P protein component [Intrasporangium sp.]